MAKVHKLVMLKSMLFRCGAQKYKDKPVGTDPQALVLDFYFQHVGSPVPFLNFSKHRSRLLFRASAEHIPEPWNAGNKVAVPGVTGLS